MPHALTELRLDAVTRPAGTTAAEPVIEITADVCVVGAGIAGSTAAIESARLGRITVLVDSLPLIGGQMVHSLIGLFCGIFGNAPEYTQLTHGVFDDIFRALTPTGDLHFAGGRDASRAMSDGRDQADRAIALLKQELPKAFGEARVRAYGHPGRRQTRWIQGVHQLSVHEVRNGTCFPDAIARTAWPVELHDRSDDYLWEMFDAGHVHYVPLRSLTPPGGRDEPGRRDRCVDGDAAALSSVRVMGPCSAIVGGCVTPHEHGGWMFEVSWTDMRVSRRRFLRLARVAARLLRPVQLRRQDG